jgi:hypothetical protein
MYSCASVGTYYPEGWVRGHKGDPFNILREGDHFRYTSEVFYRGSGELVPEGIARYILPYLEDS